ILSFHSHRVLPLLGEARIVDHPNRVRLQFRCHALTQTFPQRHPLPRALSNELLKSLYVSLVRAIGKWLDGLAFPIQQKSTNVNRTPVPSFAPAHGLQQILQELFQAFSAFLNLGIRHACEGSTSKTIRQQLNVVILDGFSRSIVHWDLRESMTEAEIEVILQRAREKYPEAKPRIISDNGPQFIARD